MSNLLSHKSIRLKKPTHGHLPNKEGTVGPVDVLIDRSQQWKHITKSLIAYYSGLAHIEKQTSTSTINLLEVIQVPFHEGNNFLGEGGWQEVLYEVRDKTKVIGDHHANLALTLESTVIKELEGVRQELKAHIAALEKEAGVLAVELEKERTISATHLTQLQVGIDTFENSQTHMMPQHDPIIVHTQVQNQLKAQLIKENDFQAALIRFQQQQPSFEKGIHNSMQSAARMYDSAKALTKKEIDLVEEEIRIALQRVADDAEYNHYASQPGTVLDPNTPFRSIEAISFPGQGHNSTIALKEGTLERKKRFTKSYKESYYVLTPSGYLHERKSNDDTNDLVPTFSLFLPECSLGVPAKESDKSHKFHVEGNKAVKSSFESKMKTGLRFGSKEIAYSFRARTHSEMMTWWTAMDQLSRDTKQAPAPTSNRIVVDPISSAVANVGYTPAVIPVTAAISPASPVRNERISTTDSPVRNTYGEEEEEEEGGSSAEEEEEIARTAPSTPYPVLGGEENPLEKQRVEIVGTRGEGSETSEGLPIYAGDGTTTAEKAALVEKGGPPVLGDPVASTSHTKEGGGGLFGFLH